MLLNIIFAVLAAKTALNNYSKIADAKLLHPEDKNLLNKVKRDAKVDALIDTLFFMSPGKILKEIPGVKVPIKYLSKLTSKFGNNVLKLGSKGLTKSPKLIKAVAKSAKNDWRNTNKYVRGAIKHGPSAVAKYGVILPAFAEATIPEGPLLPNTSTSINSTKPIVSKDMPRAIRNTKYTGSFYVNNRKKLRALGAGVTTGISADLLGFSVPKSVAIGLSGSALMGLYDNRKIINKYLMGKFK